MPFAPSLQAPSLQLPWLRIAEILLLWALFFCFQVSPQCQASGAQDHVSHGWSPLAMSTLPLPLPIPCLAVHRRLH